MANEQREFSDNFSVRKDAEYSVKGHRYSCALAFRGEDVAAAFTALELDHLPSRIEEELKENGVSLNEVGVLQVREELRKFLRGFAQGTSGFRFIDDENGTGLLIAHNEELVSK